MRTYYQKDVKGFAILESMDQNLPEKGKRAFLCTMPTLITIEGYTKDVHCNPLLSSKEKVTPKSFLRQCIANAMSFLVFPTLEIIYRGSTSNDNPPPTSIEL